MRIIAIGDIHGCFYTLVDLFNEIGDVNFEKDKVIFLGDYIDRGLYPLEVIKAVKELQEKHPDNVIVLKGNHEDICYQYYTNGNPCWTWNGYETTHNELENLPDMERIEIISWMKNLPMKYETKKFRFCHSGYWFDTKDEYGYDDVLWNRNWLEFNLQNSNGEKPIIFGHTPMNKPTYINNDLCIDTGAVYGNKLTAAIFQGKKFKTVSVVLNRKDKA